jgi:hypothetical protein
MDLTVERIGKTVVRATMDAGGVGWEWSILLRADVHHDNPYCNTALEREHLEEAKERNAGIIELGDGFCAMQGPHDPRADYSQLRDRDKRSDYFDALVDEADEFLAPYAHLFLLRSEGNHERSVLKHHGTDLTNRIVEKMRGRGSQCLRGRYQGWFLLTFRYHTSHVKTFRFRYTHGYGGGGPVTKDLIQANRQLAVIENADFLMSGHTHDAWYVPVQREWIDHDGNARQREVALIKIGGYKDEWDEGEGFAVERGRPCRPLGGWWVHFSHRKGELRYRVERVDM